jgi:hypothetical protein
MRCLVGSAASAKPLRAEQHRHPDRLGNKPPKRKSRGFPAADLVKTHRHAYIRTPACD